MRNIPVNVEYPGFAGKERSILPPHDPNSLTFPLMAFQA
jgi:hypothetical protein